MVEYQRCKYCGCAWGSYESPTRDYCEVCHSFISKFSKILKKINAIKEQIETILKEDEGDLPKG